MIDWFFSEEEEISTILKWNILTQFRINEFLPSWILLNSIISIAYLPSFRKIQILKNIPHVTHTYTHTIRWTSRARVHRVCEIANFHVPKVPKALVSPTTRKLQGFQFVPFKSRRCFPPLRLICVASRSIDAPFLGPGLSSIIDTLTLITLLVVIGKKFPSSSRKSERFLS